MQRLMIGALAAFLGLGVAVTAAPRSSLSAEAIELPDRQWSFEGIFGSFDMNSVQRGLQVYLEVCAGCHGLELIAFRNLSDLGYNEDEVKAIAANFTVIDGPDDNGEMFERPGLPFDRFPPPFANDKAAAAANGGAVPPDLSLMAKARMNGADYLHALLTGYRDPPPDFDLLDGLSYNEYFPGHQIAMAQPLDDGYVEYMDGTEATLDQMAIDVTTFLAWTAEPELEERKQMGIKVILFLIVLTGLLYAVKRKIWADLH